MKKTFLILLTLILIISCENDYTNTIVENKASNLSVKVSDKNKNAISNKYIKLYYSYKMGKEEYYRYIVKIKTDKKGFANFGRISRGTYFITVDKTEIDDKTYTYIYKKIVIKSGDDNKVDIKIEDFVASIKIKVYYKNNNTPYSNIKIALIKNKLFEKLEESKTSLNDIIKQADNIGISDNNGVVSFNNIALNKFRIIVYNQTIISTSTIMLDNIGEQKEVNIIINNKI